MRKIRIGGNLETLNPAYNFSTVLADAIAMKDKREDYTVSNIKNHMSMTDQGNLFYESKGFQYEKPMSDWATDQLSIKLGIPKGYVLKCQEKGLHALG